MVLTSEIRNLRFLDSILLIASEKEQLGLMLEKLCTKGSGAGLIINQDKTK